METNPHRWIGALRHSQDHLAALLRPLTPEQLRGPSYHDWTIAEVLGHMGSQAEIFGMWLTAALEGTDPPGRESMQPVWDAWNARAPEDAVRDSLDANERLVQRFEALTDEQLATMHLSLFGMELDGSGLPRLRLAEHALHTWDVAVTLDLNAQLLPEAVDLLIDTLSATVARSGKPLERPLRLHVQTEGPHRDFGLLIGDEVQLTDWDGTTADGDLRIPAEAFVRLVYGRLDPAHTPPVELTGPVTLDDLRSVFPGV
jgi:uncharacterized protein (TIGR03083 family)